PRDSPGIDIRPITTLTGDQHFCEVFYDEVRISLRNVVGQLHDGWRVAMATLGFERGTAFLSEQIRLARRLEDLAALARTVPGPREGRALDGGEHGLRLSHHSRAVSS